MSNNLDLKKIVINAEETLGTNLMLVDAPRPAYVYENEKRTDKVAGYNYQVLSPGLAYEKVTVKVAAGGNQPPIISPDDWEGGSALPVVFKNLHLTLSQDFRTKAVRLWALADAIEFLQEK